MRLTPLIAASLAIGACALPPTYSAQWNCVAGQLDGPFAISAPDGSPAVQGEFAAGRRVGVWSVFTSRGVRVHEIPYADGVMHGTERMWYSIPEAAGEAKAENDFSGGLLDGHKRSWFPGGVNRAEFDYEAGHLVEARAWSPTGDPLPLWQARQRAESDFEADAELRQTLESFIGSYLPECTPAS